MAYNYEDLKSRGFSKRDRDHLPIPELMKCMREWIRRTQPV
jgi:hypothetical protein